MQLVKQHSKTLSGLGLGLLFAIPLPAMAATKISPQMVVDRVLERSNRVKSAELTAQRSYLGLETALSAFDLSLKVTPGYQYSEAQNIAGTANPIDRTLTVNTSVSKKFRTGTTLGVAYDYIDQVSTVATTSSRASSVSSQVVTFSVNQALLRNYFGLADRLAVENAENEIFNAHQTREESLEDILLSGMTLYWNAYVAQEQLAANISARDKYDTLVKNVRRKSSFNLSTPGELPRLEAELAGAEQRVKQSSADYLNSVESLLTAMKSTVEGDVVFEVPKDLPPVPRLELKSIDDLRVMKIARVKLENTERIVRATKSQGLPRLDLVAKALSTGIEQEPNAARAEMMAGSHPTYFIGVEFETRLDSALVRGTLADVQVQLQQAELELRQKRDEVTDLLKSTERNVLANFSIAKMKIETVDWRERVVRELESSYRQGRQPLVELIRAYNDLFTAQLERARAIGNYHVSLNQLAAARDELVANLK